MIKEILNKYITRIKGESYALDPSIPPGYLIQLALSRITMKIRGRISFMGRANVPFIASSVRIKSKSKITFGRAVSIGRGVYIDALSREGVVLGNNVSIGRNTAIECTGNLRFLGKGLKVGDNAGLGTDCFYGCAGGISIGKNTIVGNYVSFHSENHIFSLPGIPIKLQGVTHKGITVGNDCWIGAKVTVLDGAIIEDGCIIAAGALVADGVYNKNGIYGGVPAKLMKYRFNE